MSKYYTRPAQMDPENSVSVFERGRENSAGEPYCLLAAVTRQEADAAIREWDAADRTAAAHPEQARV